MNGLERRLDRMFSRGSLIVAAADHGQFAGVPQGLEDIGRYVSEIETLDIDGILLNPGVVSRIASFDANKLLIIRVTHAGSALSGDIGNTKYFLDPEQALRLGADAVIVMGIVGQERDSDARLEALVLPSTRYLNCQSFTRRTSLPIMEIYPNSSRT